MLSTVHKDGCSFEDDIDIAFYARTGSGECSGSAQLERNPPRCGGLPELSLSNGWNASVHWTIKFCPLCGVPLVPVTE